MKSNWFDNKIKVVAIVFGLVFFLGSNAHSVDNIPTESDLTNLLTEKLGATGNAAVIDQITEFVSTLSDDERNSFYQFIQTDINWQRIKSLSDLLDLFRDYDTKSAIDEAIDEALAEAIKALDEFVNKVNSPSL